MPNRALFRSAALASLLTLAACRDQGPGVPPVGQRQAAALEALGNDQEAEVGEVLSILVRVADRSGRPVAGVTVRFTSHAGPGTGFQAVDAPGAVESQLDVVSGASGVAAARWAVGTRSGAIEGVAAVVGGAAGLMTELRAVALPGPPASLDAVSPLTQPIDPGPIHRETVVVTASDRYGNGVPHVTIRWTPGVAGAVTFPTSFTDSLGRAETTWTIAPVTGALEGPYSIGASVGGRAAPALRQVFTRTAGSAPFQAVAVSIGFASTCAATGYGATFCWGPRGARADSPWPAPGRVPGGQRTDAPVTPLEASPGFKEVAAGFEHACGLTSAGAVLCWGDDASGQVTGAPTGWVSVPTLVPLPEAATALTAGSNHTCALGRSARAWCWGSNASGELGDTAAVGLTSTPRLVGGGLSFAELAAGAYRTCGRTAAGDVMCWGSNEYGANFPDATLGGPALRHVPGSYARVATSWAATCGLTTSGSVWCWGGGLLERTQVEVPPLRSLYGGPLSDRLCGITEGGTTYCWSLCANEVRATGCGQLVLDVVALPGPAFRMVTVGFGEGCGLAYDDSLYCWSEFVPGRENIPMPVPRPGRP